MEKLNVSGVTLQGFAQGGWRTSIHVAEFGCIFDAGTTLPVASDKYFITHGHPDHAGAIPSIVARRSIQDAGDTHIYVPRAIEKNLNAALDNMAQVFGGRRSLGHHIHGLVRGDEVKLRKDVKVRVLRTYHGVPSVGYGVITKTRKLKLEFQGVEGHELGRLKREGVEITDERENVDLVIPGDTKIDFLLNCEEARKAKVLLHEVTVWDSKLSSPAKTRRYGHTHVDEMIEHCEKFEGQALVLVHRSMKHTRKEIEGTLKRRFPTSMLSKIHLFDGGDRQRNV